MSTNAELIVRSERVASDLDDHNANMDRRARTCIRELVAALKSMEQAITDPENQPSQFGTVLLATHQALESEVERLTCCIDDHTKLCVKRVAEVTRERNALRSQLAAAQGQKPAPTGFVPVAESVLRTLAEPGLIKSTLGKFSPALSKQMGFTEDEEKALAALYFAFGESFDYPCAALDTAQPVQVNAMLVAALEKLVAAESRIADMSPFPDKFAAESAEFQLSDAMQLARAAIAEVAVCTDERMCTSCFSGQGNCQNVAAKQAQPSQYGSPELQALILNKLQQAQPERAELSDTRVLELARQFTDIGKLSELKNPSPKTDFQTFEFSKSAIICFADAVRSQQAQPEPVKFCYTMATDVAAAALDSAERCADKKYDAESFDVGYSQGRYDEVMAQGPDPYPEAQPEPDAHAKFAKVPMADARTHGPQIIKVDIEFPGIYASVNLNGFTLASHELPPEHKTVVLGYRVQHLPEVWFGLGYRHGDVYWLGATGLEPNYHCLNADQIVIWRKVDMPFSFDEGRQDTNEYLQYRYILGDAAWETEETSKADRLAKQAQPEPYGYHSPKTGKVYASTEAASMAMAGEVKAVYLAKQAQPVCGYDDTTGNCTRVNCCKQAQPERAPLSIQEIADAWGLKPENIPASDIEAVREIEAAHGIKQGGQQ